jgi:hypothetical protein
MPDALTSHDPPGRNSYVTGRTANALTVFPNPTSGHFTLDTGHHGNQESLNVEIFNLVGKRVYTLTIGDKPYELDLSDLPVGIYLVKVFQGSEVLTGKVVLNR